MQKNDNHSEFIQIFKGAICGNCTKMSAVPQLASWSHGGYSKQDESLFNIVQSIVKEHCLPAPPKT